MTNLPTGMQEEFEGPRSHVHTWEPQPLHPEQGQRANSSHFNLSGPLPSQLGNGIGSLAALSFCDSMVFLPNSTLLSRERI